MKRPSGNGEFCPLVPEHGRMYVLPTGRQWCAHQTHDSKSTALYESDAKHPIFEDKR